MEDKYDIIIVGAGHNGLVAAAYLARSGRRVLALERRSQLGGAAATEELFPGYKVNSGAEDASLFSDKLVQELNLVLRGWLNYFKHARMLHKLRAIESWLNRRIRCFRLKQCKRALTMAKFLHSLGVPWNRSWTTAGSSKGWYRLSVTHAAHEAMNLKWFKSIGLYSLKENYVQHLKKPPSTTNVRWVV